MDNVHHDVDRVKIQEWQEFFLATKVVPRK